MGDPTRVRLAIVSGEEVLAVLRPQLPPDRVDVPRRRSGVVELDQEGRPLHAVVVGLTRQAAAREGEVDVPAAGGLEGVEALRADLPEQALALFEQVLELDPGHPLTRDFIEIADAKRSEQRQEAQLEPLLLALRPLEVSEIRPSGYGLGVLKHGEPVYVDRDFRLESVPPDYSGLVSLQTANDDKRDPSVAVSFRVNREVEVLVAYDQRIKARPAWLGAFARTGERLIVLERIEEQAYTVYDIFSAAYPAGAVELGMNHEKRSKHKASMYLVFFRPIP